MCKYCTIYTPPSEHQKQVIHDMHTALALVSKYYGPKTTLIELLTEALEEQKHR